MPLAGWPRRVVCFTDCSAGWERCGLTCRWMVVINQATMLEVLNFGAAGPNLRLAPHAEPSDGLLDVVLVDEHHRRDLADHLSLSQLDPARTPTLPVYQGRHFTLSCVSCNLHLDDEVWTGQVAGEDPINIDLVVEPKALTFLVPRARVRPSDR
jgi:diacylglycerol kinase (ATP)